MSRESLFNHSNYNCRPSSILSEDWETSGGGTGEMDCGKILLDSDGTD